VLHRDRVKARIIRYDRKGRPEGRILEILERRKSPIIGRLLHESGIWLVAPEDKRYGQDIMIPKNAIANADPLNPGVQPRPAPGIQFVDIPEFPALGTQVSQYVSSAIAGQLSVSTALERGQRLADDVAERYRSREGES